MIDILLLCFFLVAVTAGCAVVSHRLGIPHSIVLVITGLALALIPGLPKVELDPEIVLLLFLPPLLYWAGVSMSWRGFWNDIEAITLQAIGCVVFTTCAVAVVAHYVVNLPWAVGFVLGAVVSPPDVVAPMAVARRLQIPHRVLTILEGEGLVNDATALIIFRFAVAAVATGTFNFGNAVAGFVAIVIGEICYGIGIGWIMLRLRRWIRDPDVEITLAMLTPYLAFWLPEILGGSGVLAAVASGLYVSWNGSNFIPSNTRLQGVFIWHLAVYLIEALLFLLTGLQAKTMAESLSHGDWSQLILHGAIIGALVIAIRFAWVYPAVYLPHWLWGRPVPPWQGTFAVAFTGIRGVVSLAAAFSIPLMLPDGQPFPERDTVLFITFCVILMTLLGQGSILPFVYTKLGLVERGRREMKREEQREIKARINIVKSTLARLGEQTEGTELADALMVGLHARHRDRLYRLEQSYETANSNAVRHREELERQLILAERERIRELLQSGELTDEAKRRIERELDLEEAQSVRSI